MDPEETAMDLPPTPPPPPPPPAPPTAPGDLALPKRQSVWPGVVGTISIVLGALASAASAWQAVGPFFLDVFLSMMPEESRTQLSSYTESIWTQVAVGLVSLAAAIVLIIAGVRLVQRRRVAVPLLWTWIVLKTLSALATTAMTLYLQKIQFEAAGSQTAALPAGVATFILVATGVLTLGWYLLYPAFIAVWILRPKIRAEVGGWSR